MGDGKDIEIITATLVGREVLLKRPTDDQIMGWMGIAGSMVEQGEDLGEDEEGRQELILDIGLVFDALLSCFVEDKDRRMFRREVVLGNASIEDLVKAVMPGKEEAPTTGPKPRVRRK